MERKILLFLFCLGFLIFSIKVEGLSINPVIPNEGNLNPSPFSPSIGEEVDFSPVDTPIQLSTSSSLDLTPPAGEVSLTTLQAIQEQLKPLIQQYLDKTQRSLDILPQVVDNFSLLISENIYSIQEIKNILSQELTPQIEEDIAGFLDKESLDLTKREDVEFLVHFGYLLTQLVQEYSPEEVKAKQEEIKTRIKSEINSWKILTQAVPLLKLTTGEPEKKDITYTSSEEEIKIKYNVSEVEENSLSFSVLGLALEGMEKLSFEIKSSVSPAIIFGEEPEASTGFQIGFKYIDEEGREQWVLKRFDELTKVSFTGDYQKVEIDLASFGDIPWERDIHFVFYFNEKEIEEEKKSATLFLKDLSFIPEDKENLLTFGDIGIALKTGKLFNREWNLNEREDLLYIDYLVSLGRENMSYLISLAKALPYVERYFQGVKSPDFLRLRYWDISSETLLRYTVENTSPGESVLRTLDKIDEELIRKFFLLSQINQLINRELNLGSLADTYLWNFIITQLGFSGEKDFVDLNEELTQLLKGEGGALHYVLPVLDNLIKAQSDPVKKGILSGLRKDFVLGDKETYQDFLKRSPYDLFLNYALLLTAIDQITPQKIQTILNYALERASNIEEFNYWLRIKTQEEWSNFLKERGIVRDTSIFQAVSREDFFRKLDSYQLLTPEIKVVLSNLLELTGISKKEIEARISDLDKTIRNSLRLLNLPEKLTMEKIEEINDRVNTIVANWLNEKVKLPTETKYDVLKVYLKTLEKKEEIKDLISFSFQRFIKDNFANLSIEELDSLLTLTVLSQLKRKRIDLDGFVSEKEIQHSLYTFVSKDKYGTLVLNKTGEKVEDKVEDLVRAYPARKEFIIETAVKILLEDLLGREINPAHYKDFILLSYWKEKILQNELTIQELQRDLSLRKSIMPQENGKFALNKKLYEHAAGDREYGELDWWPQEANQMPLDKLIDTYFALRFYREILLKTLWNFGNININEPREGPFVRYFSDYLPLNGFLRPEVLNFILQKTKLAPYSEAQVMAREDRANYAGWKLSNPVEAMLSPYQSTEVKQFLIYHPEIKALVEALVGRPQYTYNPDVPAQEMMLEDARKMVQYFLDTQDKKSGIFKDAGGSVDNSTGVTGFGIIALIIGHQIGMISDEEFIERIEPLLDFFIDDPDDPTDLSAEHWYEIFYHYYQGSSDRRSGNNETSMIDSAGLLRAGLAGLTRYLSLKKIPGYEPLLTKAQRIQDEMDYSAYLAVASVIGPKFSPVLNYGYTKERLISLGIIDTYHEYILANIFGVGQKDPAKAIPWFSYYMCGKPTMTSLEGGEFVFTWERHNPFQYAYPWLLMNSRFIKDGGSLLGTSAEVTNVGLRGSIGFDSSLDLNYYQNSIQDKRNMLWQMILLSPTFRHLGYNTWWFSSMLIPEYYNMDFYLDKGGNYRYEGTLTPSEYMMALAFMPGRALDAYRYALSAYQPFIEGEWWMVDSFNPERHFVAPTEFGLGNGAALMGLWNSLVYNNPAFQEYLSVWDMVGDSDDVIRGMLRTGYQEDGETIEELTGSAISDFSEEKVETYLSELRGRDISEWESVIKNWISLPGLNNPDFNALAEAIKRSMTTTTNTGLGGQEATIYEDTERNIILFRLLREVREAQIRSNIGEIKKEVTLEVAGKTVDYFLGLGEDEFISILRGDRSDGDYKYIAELLQTSADSGDINAQYRLALTHIYRIENLRKAMSYPDERAIYAYQYYLKIEQEEKPYEKAVALLDKVVKSSPELKIKAQTYKFVALRRGLLDYEGEDGWKQAFIELNQELNQLGGKGNQFVHETITEFFGEEILTILYKQGKIRRDELEGYISGTKKLTDFQSTINEYIDLCLENSDPTILTHEEIALNELSLIPWREIAGSRNREINLYSATQAGKLGFYITQLVLEGTPAEKVEEFLLAMYRWKPVVDAIRKEADMPVLDLWGSDEDVSYLSYVVSLALSKQDGERIFSDEEIIRLVAKEYGVEDEINLEELLRKLNEFSPPQEYTNALTFRQRLSRYLESGDANGQLADEILNVVVSSMNISEKDAQQLVEFVQDLLITSELNFELVLKSIDALRNLEILNVSNNTWFSGGGDKSTAITDIFQGRLLRFKGESLYFDYRDPQNRAWAREIFELIELCKALGYIDEELQYGEVLSEDLDDNKKLILATWYLFLKEKGIILPLKNYTRISEDLKKVFAYIPAEIRNNPEKMAFLPFYLWDKSVEELTTGNIDYDTIAGNVPTGFNNSIFTQFNISSEWQKIIYNPEEFGKGEDVFALARLLMRINRVKEIENNFAQLNINSSSLQQFLSDYVLGVPFDPNNPEHREVYREWALYRIPEVQECLHRVVLIGKGEDDHLYFFGKAVMEKGELPTGEVLYQQRRLKLLPQAKTAIDELKERFISPLIELHGEEELLNYIWKGRDISRGFTLDNIIWNAILSYYAQQEDPLQTLLSLGITKFLTRGIGDFKGLEGLYGERFDLLRTDYEKGYKGIAGFYETRVRNLAGIGVLDVFLQELINKGGFSKPEDILDYLLPQWDNFSRILPELSPEETLNLTTAYLKTMLEQAQANITRIKQALESDNPSDLAGIFQESFGWKVETAREVAQFFWEEYNKATDLEKGQIIIRSALLLASQEKIAEELSILTQLRQPVEEYLKARFAAFGIGSESLNLFSIKDMGVLSFYATEVLTGRRTLEEAKEFLRIAKELLERAKDEPILKAELGIDPQSDEYKFNLELYKVKESVTELSPSQLETFNSTFIDGKISFWTEQILKGRITVDGLVRLLELRDKITPILERAGLLKINQEDISYQ
ncbi:MAG: hypothetical protein AB7E08_03030, partial [Candidatus Omnitrophota bacterium]